MYNVPGQGDNIEMFSGMFRSLQEWSEVSRNGNLSTGDTVGRTREWPDKRRYN